MLLRGHGPHCWCWRCPTRRTIRARHIQRNIVRAITRYGPLAVRMLFAGIGIVLVVGALLNYKSSGECAVGENRLHLDRWCELTADMEQGERALLAGLPKSGTPPGRCMGGTACGRTRLAGRWAATRRRHPCRGDQAGLGCDDPAELTR